MNHAFLATGAARGKIDLGDVIYGDNRVLAHGYLLILYGLG